MHRGKPEAGALNADLYYNEEEASAYHHNTRVAEIQRRMSERAIELLALPNEKLHLLDIGCGSGLSGELLSELGHTWAGVDLSPSMLKVALAAGCEGELMVGDIGEGLPFRAGTFDGAISVSTVQWLCTAFKSSHQPKTRIKRFFESLFACMRKGTRVVIQLYPEDKHQLDMITMSALRSGFSGGVVVDYPNSTRAKKMFLVLMCGQVRQISNNDFGPFDFNCFLSVKSNLPLPQGHAGGDEEAARDTVAVAGREKQPKRRTKNGKRTDVKKKDWISAKKDRRRAQGKKTANDSKFTGRSRGPRF